MQQRARVVVVLRTDNPQPAGSSPLDLAVDNIFIVRLEDRPCDVVTDADNTAVQLTYTVNIPPANGQLRLSGTPTTSFTQADIDASAVSEPRCPCLAACSYQWDACW